LTNTGCYRCILRAVIIGLPLTAATGVGGCGTTMRDAASVEQILFVSGCEHGMTGRPDVVVLDWNGGTSAIYPHDPFDGIDLALFETPDGATLAADAESFKEQVRLEVARIFCEWPELDVLVYNSEDAPAPADTLVYITRALQPGGGADIGEAEYDPCNRQNDNVAVIFGERIRRLGAGYTFEEWVHVFANVCAHEIGHTLGYGHISREEMADADETSAIELMLSHHTMAEMRTAQRFVADQTYCPDDLYRNRGGVETVLGHNLHDDVAGY